MLTLHKLKYTRHEPFTISPLNPFFAPTLSILLCASWSLLPALAVKPGSKLAISPETTACGIDLQGIA